MSICRGGGAHGHVSYSSSKIKQISHLRIITIFFSIHVFQHALRSPAYVLGARKAGKLQTQRIPMCTPLPYAGCLRDVQLNGQPLLVEGRSTEFGLIRRRQGVTMGCHSSACSSQPCYSPFLCVDLWRKYECRYIKLFHPGVVGKLFFSTLGWTNCF